MITWALFACMLWDIDEIDPAGRCHVAVVCTKLIMELCTIYVLLSTIINIIARGCILISLYTVEFYTDITALFVKI